MPVTMTRPRAARIVSTAATKGAPSPSDMAALSAPMPSASVSSVRSAEAIVGLAAVFGFLASGALIFARVPTHNSTDLDLTRNIPSVEAIAALFRPGRKCVGEGAVARRTLFHRQDGAAAIVIDDRNIEPRPVF